MKKRLKDTGGLHIVMMSDLSLKSSFNRKEKIMCYKDEVQKKNAEKLQRKFEEENVPDFIRDYFYNLNSEAGKLNYYSIVVSMLKWMIGSKRINKESLSKITEQDINLLSKTDIIVYLETLISSGTSPSTINTKKNVLSSFWSH